MERVDTLSKRPLDNTHSCCQATIKVFFLGDPEVGEVLPGELDVSLDVLADDGLLVGAGDVVPLDAVAVEVVEHGHARLGLAALGALAVVGLAHAVSGNREEKLRIMFRCYVRKLIRSVYIKTISYAALVIFRLFLLPLSTKFVSLPGLAQMLK